MYNIIISIVSGVLSYLLLLEPINEIIDIKINNIDSDISNLNETVETKLKEDNDKSNKIVEMELNDDDTK